jgi:hypothetical protein
MSEFVVKHFTDYYSVIICDDNYAYEINKYQVESLYWALLIFLNQYCQILRARINKTVYREIYSSYMIYASGIDPIAESIPRPVYLPP